MAHRANSLVVAACTAVLLASAPSSAQQLTARDAFWSAGDLVSVSNNTAAAKHEGKSAAHSGEQKAHTSTPAKVTQEKHIDPAVVASNGYGAEPHLVNVSSQQMGLRYSLLLQDAAGAFVEVAPGQAFHSGEKIRLSIMANQPGYLYVIDQGSSGHWAPIYPSAGAPPEANRVEAGKLYVVPNHTSFRFDPPAGNEKLYIIVSRDRLADLDATIQNLKGPAEVQPAKRPMEQTMEASNNIPDALVEHLASRDLTLVQEQQVDDKAGGDDQGGEKAVYVVSKGVPPGARGPQVVAAVTLRHE